MEFNVRMLSPTDYDDTLVGWWKDWGWTPPPKDFLPKNGEGGFMILDNETPVCAGFMYATNSAVAWVEFIISNKQYKKKPHRTHAIALLIHTIAEVCKSTGFKYCYSTLKNRALIKTYENLGFTRGDINSCEMIKIL